MNDARSIIWPDDIDAATGPSRHCPQRRQAAVIFHGQLRHCPEHQRQRRAQRPSLRFDVANVFEKIYLLRHRSGVGLEPLNMAREEASLRTSTRRFDGRGRSQPEALWHDGLSTE